MRGEAGEAAEFYLILLYKWLVASNYSDASCLTLLAASLGDNAITFEIRKTLRRPIFDKPRFLSNERVQHHCIKVTR